MLLTIELTILPPLATSLRRWPRLSSPSHRSGAPLTLAFALDSLWRRGSRSSRAPFKLTFLFQCHNLFLTTASAILLALMLEEM